jgi:8-oxo-dGTP pyrophosphatase MutT (NUDIX family)
MYPSEKAESPREAEKNITTPSVQVALMRHTSSGDIEFFLLHRITESFPDQWCFPGGRIDPGETVVQTATRETFEESGIVINSDDLTFIRDTEVSTIKKINGESITHIYPIKFFAVFTDNKSPFNASPEEHDAGRWFTSKEILGDNLFSEQLINGRYSLAPIISQTTKDSVNFALTCHESIKQAI